jgi:hypothetical protein
MTVMELHVLFGAIAFVSLAFIAALALVIVGIQRGDHGKRLVGRPGSRAEALARQLLSGSLRCDSRDNTEESR